MSPEQKIERKVSTLAYNEDSKIYNQLMERNTPLRRIVYNYFAHLIYVSFKLPKKFRPTHWYHLQQTLIHRVFGTDTNTLFRHQTSRSIIIHTRQTKRNSNCNISAETLNAAYILVVCFSLKKIPFAQSFLTQT